LSTNGTGFTVIHDFTNSLDGSTPGAATAVGNELYGATYQGGAGYGGSIFSVFTNGTGFQVLQNFGISSGPAEVVSDLVVNNHIIYATAYYQSVYHSGEVIELYTDGSAVTPLHVFSTTSGYPAVNSDGAYPEGLVLANGALYGAAISGSTNAQGAVFALSPLSPPQPSLAITTAGTNALVSWTDLASGFALQSCTNLTNAAWANVPGNPVDLNGQFVLTNGINPAGQAECFYRLLH
jgi:uncharacterized repeat protein (TIGR03803 family)